MKRLIQITFLVSTIFVSACAPQTNSQYKKEKRVKDYSRYRNLAEVLRSEGLQVYGVGDNVQVYLRGQSTIMLETQPLYVLDNSIIGNDYVNANARIDPNNIYDVKVLRDLSQTLKYGEQGNHGVIQIFTKQYNEQKEAEKREKKETKNNGKKK